MTPLPPQKPARRFTNPRMGARAAMQEQERQEEEERQVGDGSDSPLAGGGGETGAPKEVHPRPDTVQSTAFPTEEQVEAAARAIAEHYDDYEQMARDALAVVAPLVNGIADQRDAAAEQFEALAAMSDRHQERAEAAEAEVERLRSEWQRDTATGWESTKQERRSLALAFGMDPEEALQLDFVACANSLRSERDRAVAALSAVRAELEASEERWQEAARRAEAEADRAQAAESGRETASTAALANLRERDEARAELASLREELAAKQELIHKAAKELWTLRRQVRRAGSLPDNAQFGPFAFEKQRDGSYLLHRSGTRGHHRQALWMDESEARALVSWLSPVVPAVGPITAEALYRAAAVPVGEPAELDSRAPEAHAPGREPPAAPKPPQIGDTLIRSLGASEMVPPGWSWQENPAFEHGGYAYKVFTGAETATERDLIVRAPAAPGVAPTEASEVRIFCDCCEVLIDESVETVHYGEDATLCGTCLTSLQCQATDLRAKAAAPSEVQATPSLGEEA